MKARLKPRTVVPVDSLSNLLIDRGHLQKAVIAVVRAGQQICPLRQMCPQPEVPPHADFKQLQQHAGIKSQSAT